ncbi:MAG: hypothetical protein ACON35_02020 [Candidatus Marinamargulisbacteria bacterium]
MNKISSFKRQDRLCCSKDPFGCTAFLEKLTVDAKKIREIKGYFKELEMFFNKHERFFIKPSIEIYHIPSKTRLTGCVLDIALTICPDKLKKNIDNGDNVVFPSFLVKRKCIHLSAPIIYRDSPKKVGEIGDYKHLFFSVFLKRLITDRHDVQYSSEFRSVEITDEKVCCKPKNNLGDYLTF